MLAHDLPANRGRRPLAQLFLILDLYSRKIVGWEVHDSDGAEHATQVGPAHRSDRTDRASGTRATSGTAQRQRCLVQGHHGAGDAALAGHQALVLTPTNE